MWAFGRDSAPARLNGDDPADDLAALNPLHTQDARPLVVRFELDRRHIVSPTSARQFGTKLDPPKGSRAWELLGSGRLHRGEFRAGVKTILAPTDSQVLLQCAHQFAATLFDAGGKTDARGEIGSDLWSEFRRSGLAMSPFPEAGLGSAGGHNELCTILRLLGSADLSLARLFEGHVNAVSLVRRYGTREQMRGLADRISRGGLSAVWGADDAEGLQVAGSDVQRLRGRKILASGAGFVTDPLVTAKAQSGQVMCLLQLTTTEKVDLSGWTAQGMRSTATGAVDLTGTELSSAHMIGAPGDFIQQPYFSGGAWRFCAAHLGAIERLVDLFRGHLVARNRVEDPYQLQRLAQSIASAKTARFWVEEAARRLSADEGDAGSIVAFANLTRMVTERAALDVMENVQRGVGLLSFIRPNPIERISRDLATYLRQPVPDLAMSDGARAFLNSSLSVGDF
jgi:alkylation response protein AidB-like acyl-CoA dehydrogenase